jgi:hypothetical protein
MSNYFRDETAEDTVARKCLACCLNADVLYLGVRGDRVFFAFPNRPSVHLSLPVERLTPDKIAQCLAEWDRKRGKKEEERRTEETGLWCSGTIETTLPATAEPELGERWCPNGHDSSLPPRLPELIFFACGHYLSTEFTWNEFCITCGIRHVAFRIFWRGYEGRLGGRVHNSKNFCGFCGAKMVQGEVS